MLVHAPEADVAVAEGVPPGVEHLAVEAENAFAGYARGRRSERGEAVIDVGAILIADAREQMPESQSVVLARIGEDDAEQDFAFRCRVGSEIKFGQGSKKRRRGLFKVRCARTDFRAGCADGSSRDEGLAAAQLEADPAHGGAQKARAGIVYTQRVDTSQVHGDSRRRVHNKLAGRRPDSSSNRAALEIEPLVAGA